MEAKLDPTKDDLPLMANTSHMLVKHYVLDLDVDFKSQVIEGIIVLFLETGSRYGKASSIGREDCLSHFNETCKTGAPEPCHIPLSNASIFSSEVEYNDFAVCGKGEKDTSGRNGNHSNEEQASGISSSKRCCDTESHGNKDFLLVLDCCDLSVLKVEEVDIAAVSDIEKFTMSTELMDVSKELENLRNQIVHELVTLPSDRCQEQLYYYSRCSQAPGCGELLFTTGSWSLEIRKRGVQTPTDFPHAIRIWYRTKPEGRSVTWTTDQSGRGGAVYKEATDITSWYYYVTMPMPASTFTIAVGCWQEVKQQCFTADIQTENEFPTPFSQADFRHSRTNFLKLKSDTKVLQALYLTPMKYKHYEFSKLLQYQFLQVISVCYYFNFGQCPKATVKEKVLQTYLIRLSQDEGKEQQELKALLRWQRLKDEVQNSEEELQVLRPHKESTGEVSESGASVVKHGLKAEKIFMQVHYLKGYFLLRSLANTLGEASYLASLRKFVHKFHGQLVLSQDFLSMLLEDIPELKESGLTVESISQNWLDTSGIPKVTKWIQANQRIRKSSKKRRKQDEVVFQKLLPDQLVLLLEYLLEEKTLCPRTLQCLEKTYQLHDQDAEVRHRWCELVVKHKYVPGYGDVEKFLREDQAMGVYLYGELMVNEDAKQQELAYKCFAAAREQMDTSSAKVVAEMLF
ncbi:UNVERIFIED_CONTAM: hypothetical protein H355_006943 [Colinus virginianus]|nr:hypothetical protein H355_006943 [Colinus virginianus]